MTPTSDRSNDNESGEQSGGEAEQKHTHTPGTWAWERRGAVHELNTNLTTGAKMPVLYAANAYGPAAIYVCGKFKCEPLQPDHPDAKLIASAPAMHTELHRLRSERAELLAACEVSIELITDLQSRCATTDGAHLETSMMSVPVVNRLKEIIANAKGTTNE